MAACARSSSVFRHFSWTDICPAHRTTVPPRHPARWDGLVPTEQGENPDRRSAPRLRREVPLLICRPWGSLKITETQERGVFVISKG